MYLRPKLPVLSQSPLNSKNRLFKNTGKEKDKKRQALENVIAKTLIAFNSTANASRGVEFVENNVNVLDAKTSSATRHKSIKSGKESKRKTHLHLRNRFPTKDVSAPKTNA